MNRFAVESGSLAWVSYFAEQSLLEVEFRDGTHYQFFAVPPHCFQELLASDSKGRYFNGNIRNRFRFQCVTGQGQTAHQEN